MKSCGAYRRIQSRIPVIIVTSRVLTLAEQTQLAGQTAAILAKGTLAPQTVQDALAAALGDTP